VKKIATNHNEKILDKDWLRRRGCALGRDSVCSTGDSVFEHAHTSGPELTDTCIPEVPNTCNPDIANARGYFSRKST